MKKCTVCHKVKEDSHFGKYPKDYCRCNVCHSRITEENKAEILRNKEARIMAYATGEMPRSNKPNAVYIGRKVEIENKLIDRELEKQLRDLDL